tara:strand:- start:488 stop:1084 length:597 start_codon:yes stop_codon:yes gene_type:complete
MAINQVDRYLPEGSTAFYRAAFTDEDGVRINSADIDSITLTLYDVDSGAIINSRDSQSVHDANGGTYAFSNASITDATNADPIVITSNAHGLSSKDVVNVSGVLGIPSANGSFAVTKVDANSFSLDRSAANGTYTSGGTWTRSRFQVEFSPDDMTIVDSSIGANQVEHHRALFVVTYDATKKITHEVDLYVTQIQKLL